MNTFIFNQIGNHEGLEEAKKKCVECTKVLKKLNTGIDVDEVEFPMPVTPAFIYRMTEKERILEFQNVLKWLKEKKIEAKTNLDNKTEAVKKLKKADFAKNKAQITKIFEDLKNKQKGIEMVFDNMVNSAKNKWIPAPSLQKIEEEVKEEVINDDLDELDLQVVLKKTNYDKTGLVASIKLRFVLKRHRDS